MVGEMETFRGAEAADGTGLGALKRDAEEAVLEEGGGGRALAGVGVDADAEEAELEEGDGGRVVQAVQAVQAHGRWKDHLPLAVIPFPRVLQNQLGRFPVFLLPSSC